MKNIEEAAEEYMNIPPVKAAIKCGDVEDLESHIKVAYKNGWEDGIANQWISVEDELPPICKTVVFLVSVYGRINIHLGDRINDSNIWDSISAGIINNGISNKVTHWLPIPELPK